VDDLLTGKPVQQAPCAPRISAQSLVCQVITTHKGNNKGNNRSEFYLSSKLLIQVVVHQLLEQPLLVFDFSPLEY
jgi:hypothetical protein